MQTMLNNTIQSHEIEIDKPVQEPAETYYRYYEPYYCHAPCLKCHGAEKERHKDMAADAVEQYNIAKQEGNHTKTCLNARIVTAAYLKANNEAKYQQWKAITEAECRM